MILKSLGSKWTGIPKKQDMGPTDTISQFPRHRNLQLMKHLFSLPVFVPVPCMCVCAQVCLCCLYLYVFLYVCMCPAHCSGTDEGNQTWDVEQPEKEAGGIHSLGETGSLISALPLSRKGRRKGWPVTTQDSRFTNLQLHQETLISSQFPVLFCVFVPVSRGAGFEG